MFSTFSRSSCRVGILRLCASSAEGVVRYAVVDTLLFRDLGLFLRYLWSFQLRFRLKGLGSRRTFRLSKPKIKG